MCFISSGLSVKPADAAQTLSPAAEMMAALSRWPDPTRLFGFCVSVLILCVWMGSEGWSGWVVVPWWTGWAMYLVST